MTRALVTHLSWADFDDLWQRDFACAASTQLTFSDVEEPERFCVWIEDGRLLEVQGSDERVRFTSWSDGFDCFVLRDGGWQPPEADPQLAFVGAARRMRNDSPAGAFAMTVPEAAAHAAGAAGSFELTALRLLRRHREAWDLAATAPNLFWLLCAHVASSPGVDVSALVRSRRADLLSACIGTSTTRAAVRFVEKVVPELQSDMEARTLRRAAAEPLVVHALRHLPRVPMQVAELALARQELVVTDFFVAALAKLAADDRSGAVREMLMLCDDLRNLATELRLANGSVERALAQTRTPDALRSLHDRWMDELNALEEERALARYAGQEFPTPPYEDTADIIALRTPLDLLKEGRAMHHCVASRVRACFAGEQFIYRVVRPERATLAIAVVGGAAYVRELSGPCNARVSRETTEAVKAWVSLNRGWR